MDQITGYLTNHWLLGIIVIVLAIFIIGALIKAAIKFAIVVAIIGIILIGVVGLSPKEVLHKGKAAVDGVTTVYKNTIDPILTEEIDQANYDVKPNGDYTIKTKNIKIMGNKNDSKVTVYYKGKSYQIDTNRLSQHIQDKLDTITSNQS